MAAMSTGSSISSRPSSSRRGRRLPSLGSSDPLPNPVRPAASDRARGETPAASDRRGSARGEAPAASDRARGETPAAMPRRMRDGRRVWIPAPDPAAAPPLGPPLPPVSAAASSEDALVQGEVFQTGSGKAVLLGKDSIQKPRAPLKDNKEKPTHLRLLVSNTAAGCIFGKGGSTINHFQSQSGARIQLSRSHEFFTGTNDRIIMVSGLFDEVVKAMELVLGKILSEGGESSEAEPRPEFKLLVPNSCGIIGKGGATIKSFIEDSHSGIRISPQDNFVGLHDSLVTITGPLNSLMRGIYLILSKLYDDVHYPPNLSSPFPYAGLGFPSYPAAVPAGYMIRQVPYNDAVNYGPNGYAGGGGGRYQNNMQADTMAAATLQSLPDDLIKEILFCISPDDDLPSLLCASLVCKTWSHIAKEQLKRTKHARAQHKLKFAQLKLKFARLTEVSEKSYLEFAQRQEQLKQQLKAEQLKLQIEFARLEQHKLQLEMAQLTEVSENFELEFAQLQQQKAQLQLEMAQVSENFELECAQLQQQKAQLQFELAQLQLQFENAQLQEELKQLKAGRQLKNMQVRRRSSSSSSRAPWR